MDVFLEFADNALLDTYYSVPRDNIYRQALSLFILATIGVNLLYFVFSTLAYWTVWDKSLEKHPKFLPNQIQKEIWLSVTSFPVTTIATLPWFLLEVRGYTKLYRDFNDFSLGYFLLSVFLFLMFTDFGVYWIHR